MHNNTFFVFFRGFPAAGQEMQVPFAAVLPENGSKNESAAGFIAKQSLFRLFDGSFFLPVCYNKETRASL